MSCAIFLFFYLRNLGASKFCLDTFNFEEYNFNQISNSLTCCFVVFRIICNFLGESYSDFFRYFDSEYFYILKIVSEMDLLLSSGFIVIISDALTYRVRLLVITIVFLLSSR